MQTRCGGTLAAYCCFSWANRRSRCLSSGEHVDVIIHPAPPPPPSPVSCVQARVKQHTKHHDIPPLRVTTITKRPTDTGPQKTGGIDVEPILSTTHEHETSIHLSIYRANKIILGTVLRQAAASPLLPGHCPACRPPTPYGPVDHQRYHRRGLYSPPSMYPSMGGGTRVRPRRTCPAMIVLGDRDPCCPS